MRYLKEGSDRLSRITKLEEIMDVMNIKITSDGQLLLWIDGVKYNIGSDSNEFPRSIEEHIWRKDEY